jgi:hypothetical protein
VEFFQRIWQENRRFILQVGGGLAVFLVLNSCIVDGLIGTNAAEIRKKNGELEKGILKTRGIVVAQAPEEKRNLEELVAIEKELADRFQTARAAEVPDPKRGAPQIWYNERIGRVWSEVLAKARERNVRIPEKITTNELGVGGGEVQEELERCSSYLDILGRALKACVELGMSAVDKPVINTEEGDAVAENEDVSVVYRRVGLTAYGPYEAFKRVLAEFQKPGFIQVRVSSLDGKGTPGPNVLRGQLEFVGVFLEKEGEAAAVEGEAPAKEVHKDTKGVRKATRKPALKR